MFQSRKQDYFNWKIYDYNIYFIFNRFSPASRIILIESEIVQTQNTACQNVSVPQAGLF